jgi:2-dehydropantoate 2-reductase
MKIAVIGVGAIGSVVAAYLHKAGVDVTLIGKSEQVRAITQSGLRIKGVRGEETFRLKALTKLDQVYDLVIFSTKTQDLEEAYSTNSEYLDHCFVLTTQNGVQADNILSCHFDREKMFSSIVMFGSTYVKPAEITFNFEGDWILGKPYGPIGPKVHEISDLLRKAFKVVVTENIMGMKWTKLFVNFNNCIMAILGKSMQETFADVDFCRLSILLLREGVGITKKAKIELVSLPDFSVDKIYGLSSMPVEQASGIINKTLTALSKEPIYGSILQSILRKKTSEIDFINGEVVQLARQIREDAPLNDKIVEMVHHVERTQKFYQPSEVKELFKLGLNEVRQ